MIFFDAHVHIYPEFDPDVLFSSFEAHARRLAPAGSGLVMAVALREFQPDLGAALGSAPQPREWTISPPSAPDGCWTASRGDCAIGIFPARQVVAGERVELLGYFGEAPVPDGLPLEESACRLAGAGFASAIAWGKGKWLFRRAKIVGRLLRSDSFRAIVPFVGDSALRPLFWHEPLFGVARRRGYRFLCGSDPLPGAGNERNAGRLATLIDAEPVSSAGAMRALLAEAPLSTAGSRAFL